METKTFVCGPEGKGTRLDSWLSGKFRYFSRTYIQKLVRSGEVKVNGLSAKPNLVLKEGDTVVLSVPDPVRTEALPEKIPIDILYEDSDIIVINKPKATVVHPAAGNYSGTLVNALMDYCGESLSDINGVIRPGIVHRIDKDTTGVLVVAKNNEAHVKLSAQLKKHSIKRVYEAIVDGIINENEGTVNAPVGRDPRDRKKMTVNSKNGKSAVTHFKVIGRYHNNTYISIELETGRTHQIRVHMAFIGHPVTGDPVYGHISKLNGLKSQALHARILGFIHPGTGSYVEFEAPLPEYFKDLLTRFAHLP